ncbi:TadE/TadG family type IV pilus assembly protein [Aliivibrio wodanis]|uniref:Membrane associated secretion system protein n=1 Tax=Aliivibrio wodanis TaxID=80852 RepID=A0A090I709_9GAMM|nr:membrane associated secretion system protein [Aliivibrio wodanis]
MRLIKYKKNQKGVVAIEFALGFFGFWLMCMAWVEMSYMSYISAIGDLAIAEASRSSKVEEEKYLESFENIIYDSDSLWAGLVDTSNFRISIQYLSDIDDLVAQKDPCLPEDKNVSAECGSEVKSALAIYRIDYDFNSIFTYFMSETNVFSREVIVIQEYERSEFEI